MTSCSRCVGLLARIYILLCMNIVKQQTDFRLFCCCFLFLLVCLPLSCLVCCVHLILQDVLQQVGTGRCWKHTVQVRVS